jgi:acid phosphatase (class A)
MRRIFAGLLSAIMLAGASPAWAIEWIDRTPLETIIPPPPPRGSAIEQTEIAEILKTQAGATPAAKALARHDNDVEDPTIFASVIGPKWDLARLPKTKFLLDRVMDVDRPDSSASKHFFNRPRPWIVDARVQTCAPHEAGPALTSYPSGHAMLGYELGVVLASLIPEKAQAILARASLYGENRILCGFHFRSDVAAGQQFGSVLAVEMLHHPVFQGWFKEAKAELKAASLTR